MLLKGIGSVSSRLRQYGGRVIQKWAYNGKHLGDIHHFTPRGMRMTIYDLFRFLLMELQVLLKYPTLLNCSEEEIIKSIRDGWGSLTMIYLQNRNRKNFEQLAVLREFIQLHGMEFPEFCLLIQAMIATPPNTSPLERSYTRLEMVCAKRR